MLLLAFSLLIVFSPAPAGLRNAVFDAYQRLRPLERGEAPVVIVAIDEDSLEKYGQWPWPRNRVAELVARIGAAGAASIGLDLIFPERDRLSPDMVLEEIAGLAPAARIALASIVSNDTLLEQAIRDHPVVLGMAADTNRPRLQRPRVSPVVVSGTVDALEAYPSYAGSLQKFVRVAQGQGLLNSGPADQVVRVVPLAARVMGEVVPSLGVEAVRVGVQRGLRLEQGPGAGEITLRAGDYAIRAQEDGTTWLRYAPHDERRFVRAIDVLEGRVGADRLQGHVVLVGIYATGTDFKTTPLGQFVPGVEIHAQVAENLVNGVALRRPAWAPWLEAVALFAIGAVLVAVVPRTSALRSIQLGLGMLAVLAMAGFVAFARFDLLLDPAWPAIGTSVVFLAVVVGTLSEAERQRRVLREQAARMAGEVDAARRIQMGLLPDPRETLGEDQRFRVAALLEPARTVGGDFYDCFMVDERRLFVLVADVSGKGLPAALFMASAKSHLKSVALRTEGSVGDVFTEAQLDIQRENAEQLFVTAFAAVLDVTTGALEYSCAGHEPPWVRRPDGMPERLEAAGGPPLCVVDDFRYPWARRKLVPGEWLCIVTDGATEAMNPQREFFGAERLRAALSWMPEAIAPEDVVRRLREDVMRFADGAEAADDLTLLVLRWDGASRVPEPAPAALSGR